MKRISLTRTNPPRTHEERAAARDAQRKAVEESRKRIAALEANLSPEAKAQWDEMCGRGKTDPQLEAFKRERILINAMLSGEVLPSASWNPAGFEKRLAELEEHINSSEKSQQADQEDQAEKDIVDMLSKEQKRIEFFLRVLLKFSADDSVRQDITVKTKELAEGWLKWRDAEWMEREDGIIGINENGTYKRGKTRCPKSYRQLADGIRHNLAVYEKMLNTYAQMPTSAVSMQEKLNLLAEKVNVSAERIQAKQEKQSEQIKGLQQSHDVMARDIRIGLENHGELRELVARNHQELMKYRTGNLDRQEVAQEIADIQRELLLRERREHPLTDPVEIKGYSNARAVQFVKEDCKKDDQLYKRCECCRRDVKRIAQTEGKSESKVWSGMKKAVERVKNKKKK